MTHTFTTESGRELVLAPLTVAQMVRLAQSKGPATADVLVAYEVLRETVSDSLRNAGNFIEPNALGDLLTVQDLLACLAEICRLSGFRPDKPKKSRFFSRFRK